jgi:glycine cleavage system H lipoate-binding protein
VTSGPVADVQPEISKGYGFISLENKKSYQRILDTRGHLIKGRVVEVNLAVKKNSDAPEDLKTKGLRKLFVGGLRNEATRGRPR